MQFDLFHSIGRIDLLKPKLSDRDVVLGFFDQAALGESLGYETMWVAESHFSSEVQKSHRKPVIPEYQGEVGLNADSCQLAHLFWARTTKMGFGTAIYNIVGGNGGPIAAADRIRSLAFFNLFNHEPRRLNIGFAAGRFPYINAPFGIVPRNEFEQIFWPQIQRLIFLEAMEIFLRLGRGEILASSDLFNWQIDRPLFKTDDEWQNACRQAMIPSGAIPYPRRWDFEPLKLVPDVPPEEFLQNVSFVLGSHDPLARDHGLKFADLDIFNLSFTPPAEITRIHEEMFLRYSDAGRQWHRSRLPRTVLVFIDKNFETARERASKCFDAYIDAMRGTVTLPPKHELMSRALIGDPAMIRDQLHPSGRHGFHPDDRLMLWFEFNQNDSDAISAQMTLFAEQVMQKLGHGNDRDH